MAKSEPRQEQELFSVLLLLSVNFCNRHLRSGLCELVAFGTLASYLLGDSVTQFSTIIDTYLFAMGIGSWLLATYHA